MLAVGQPIVAEPGLDAESERFFGHVAADGVGLLTVELGAGAPSDFPPGAGARIRFWDASGLYTLTGVVVERTASQSGLRVVLRKGEVETAQRRRFFRAMVDVPATLTIVASPGGGSTGRREPGVPSDRRSSGVERVRARDISGGGLRVETDLPLSVGDDVEIDVELGQSATTLSGGEAQRVKLAAELAQRSRGDTVYVLDEPTTGLHLADVERLAVILRRLTDAGNAVVVIEHNLEIVKVADHVIDLGPEAGAAGGHIVARGTPEEVARVKESYTGRFLAPVLAQSRRAAEAPRAAFSPRDLDDRPREAKAKREAATLATASAELLASAAAAQKKTRAKKQKPRVAG